MGILGKLFGGDPRDDDRDRWWLRTDGVDEPPPDDFDEAAEERAIEAALERDLPVDPRSGYHRYDTDDDFEDGAPIYDERVIFRAARGQRLVGAVAWRCARGWACSLGDRGPIGSRRGG